MQRPKTAVEVRSTAVGGQLPSFLETTVKGPATKVWRVKSTTRRYAVIHLRVTGYIVRADGAGAIAAVQNVNERREPCSARRTTVPVFLQVKAQANINSLGGSLPDARRTHGKRKGRQLSSILAR
jgi:hypothetical protein